MIPSYKHITVFPPTQAEFHIPGASGVVRGSGSPASTGLSSRPQPRPYGKTLVTPEHAGQGKCLCSQMYLLLGPTQLQENFS